MTLNYTFLPLIVVFVLVIIPAFIVGWIWVTRQRRKARSAGFDSLGEYLRAAPVTDVEKKDAVDMALLGLVLCALALLIPPLLILGVFPLFFGMRKVAYSYMGLGLADDVDQ